MKASRLILVAACLVGCGDLTRRADDLVTVSVGEDSLRAVEIDREVMLGPERLPACLDVSITLPSSSTTVAMQNTDAGCALTVQQPDLVLFDQQEIEDAREQIGPFDVDGVRSGRVAIQELLLSTSEGSTLLLSRYVDAVTVEVDGEAVLDRIPATELEDHPELNPKLPDSLIEQLKEAVRNNQPATADVSLTLWLNDQVLTELPGSLKLHLVLQPELQVNIIQSF